MNHKKSILRSMLAVASLVCAQTTVFANSDADYNVAFNVFDGWTSFANGNYDGETIPGSGGQAFDTEYLFYKYDSSSHNLSIGLQSGFDLVDGKVRSSNNGTVYDDDYTGVEDYYAGDLALSFDGGVVTTGSATDKSNSYEYAVDFGLYTQTSKGSYEHTVQSAGSGGSNGVDVAGLYKITEKGNGDLAWDNDINSSSSSPFAMDDGEFKKSLITDAGSGQVARKDISGTTLSYWRTVTFNLDGIVDRASDFTVDAHWTMSCGNDYINGSVALTQNDAAVPEPSILALFSLGSLGLVASGYRRRKMQK